jgi:predicted methyltransferase
MFRIVLALLLASLLAACGPSEPPEPEISEIPDPRVVTEADANEAEGTEAGTSEDQATEADRLGSVLDAQPDSVKARYDDRHPRETLEFFGIEPGMTVVEALPGGGWYTRILLPYLGEEGRLVAANYALDMWPLFPFGTDEFMERIRQWPETFPDQTAEWCDTNCADVSTFWFGSLPEDLPGTADAVLFVRAMHNLARFNDEHGYLDQALTDAFAALKPGGTFGVVQHWARADMPDDWANGDAGYIKRELVVERAEAAGFELVDESDINTNPDDQPTTDDVVWRLPPSLRVPEDDTEQRERNEAIGESHRMTLKFAKPADDPAS